MTVSTATNAPPSVPSGFLGLGLARRFQVRPLDSIVDMAATYGDICSLQLGPIRAFILNHPDFIGEVLVTKHRQFRKVPHAIDVFRQVDGNGLIVSEGDLWARQRRLVQPAFQPRRMKGYATSIVSTAQRVVSSWSHESEVDMDSEMTMLACRVIAKLLFDVTVDTQVRELHQAIGTLSVELSKELRYPVLLPNWLPFPSIRRKRRSIEYLDRTVRQIIRERRASGEDKGDLLSILLAAVDQEGDLTGMSDTQARDEAITLFNAGHDTTAAGLTWTLFVMAAMPDIEASLRDEVDRVLEDRSPTYGDLKDLSFTQMVVKETLRMYPPTWSLIPRQATEDVQVGSYTIPKGAWVYISPYALHHNERYFPDPDRFDPERFAPGRAERIPRYAYLPFGAGPHVCIGNALAMMEMTLIVATIVQHVRLELLKPAEQVRPTPLVSLRPEGGLPMRVKAR